MLLNVEIVGAVASSSERVRRGQIANRAVVARIRFARILQRLFPLEKVEIFDVRSFELVR